MEIILSSVVVVLLITNVLTLYFKKKPPKPLKSLDATSLLHDLTRNGEAVIRVTVVDPESIFLRSPNR